MTEIELGGFFLFWKFQIGAPVLIAVILLIMAYSDKIVNVISLLINSIASAVSSAVGPRLQRE